MAGFFKFKRGINIDPTTGSNVSIEGDIAYNSTSHKFEFKDNSATRSVVSENGTETLTNKSIDASTNTLTNIVNASIGSGAAIAYSKLNLTGNIVNTDINSSAAIAYSKLNLSGSLVNADVNASAAIAYSKLNLSGSILNADINASAAIAYSKLALTGSVVNADINASAAIAYSKLNLSTSIVNADINASAAIAYSKLNLTGSILNADLAGSIAASKLVGSDIATVGTVTSGTWNATTIALNHGGTGQTTKAAAFDALSPMSASGDVIYGGASGTGTRLPKGSDGQVLTLASGLPSWQTASITAPTSEIWVSTPGAAGAGHGSTNTSVRRFATTVSSVGSDITFADSSTNGSTFTINTAGIYWIEYVDLRTGGTATISISKNSDSLGGGGADAITQSKRLTYVTAATGFSIETSTMATLAVNDVIRAQDDTANNDSSQFCYFKIKRVV